MTDILLGSLPDWINKWGPLLLIILTMLYIGYKLALKIFTGVGRDIVNALNKPTEALSRQAEAIDRLSDSLKDYVNRDQIEHREMIILLKIIEDHLTRFEKSVREGKDG